MTRLPRPLALLPSFLRACACLPALLSPPLVVVLVAVGAGPPAQAADQETSGAPPCRGQACDTPPPPRLLALIDKTHAGISRGLSSAVTRVDRFFATENVFEEINTSYARVPLDMILEENGEYVFKARIKGKLDLPHAKRRFKLIIESTVVEDLSETAPLAETPPQALVENDYFLSLEVQLKKTGRWKIRPATGVEFRWPPDLFGRLRAIRYFALGRRWLGRFSSTAVYLLEAGAEVEANQQFSRALHKNFLFRSQSSLKWTQEKTYTEAAQTFSVYQHLSRQANLAYHFGIFANDQAGHWQVSQHRLWLRYRRLMYKDWLFMDLIPELRFPHGEDYRPTYYLTLRIEPVFGTALPVEKLRRSN